MPVDVHPTEPWTLAAFYDGTVVVTDASTQRRLHTVAVSPGSPVRSARFVARQNWIVAASDDGHIRVVDLASTAVVSTVKAHDDFVRGLDVHPTLPLVLSCSDDKTVKLWDVSRPTWACVAVFHGHDHYVMGVQWHPSAPASASASADALVFATVSLDHCVRFWRVTVTGEVEDVRVVHAHDKGVNALAFADSGRALVTGADDHLLKVWDATDGSLRATLVGHTGNVTAVAVHPSLPLIASGAEDGTLRLWDAETYRCVAVVPSGADGRIWAASFVGDASRAVVVGYDAGDRVVALDPKAARL
ncbi:hypothetical protein P43SY_009361 [Pythium insidiosum]|uniref:Uncharacterized protein n=1 Tax=Pythium insidiosum TaxID=114742 RepID=A0AAD5L9A4_PYTIN|nr:hypothetical protein P43SY_009361 [Pythium insidiosum]